MALTLRQRANIIAGRPQGDLATDMERIAAGIAKLGGDVAVGQLTNSHAVFANGHAVTSAQLYEWMQLALGMQIQHKMVHVVMDQPALILTDDATGDASIVLESRKIIWSFAQRIGV